MRALLVVTALVLAGCASAPQPAVTDLRFGSAPPSSGEPANATLVDANTAFATQVLAALRAAHPADNVFVSPLSISVALAMALDGANGATRDAMASTLGVNASDPVALNSAYRALLAKLATNQGNVTLSIANSLWLDDAFAPHVQPGFKKDIVEAFASEGFEKDFADPATIDAINQWASDKTRGKIPTVLSEFSDGEVMVLMNAVYFQGEWTDAFVETCTRSANFTRADGERVRVTMMCGAKAEAWSSGGATTLRLPYVGDRIAMYVALDGEASFDRTDSFTANVELPRFDLKTHEDLVPTLEKLGMGIAFTNDADFGRIAPGVLLQRVMHDAVLQVNETGTVAAAVTTVTYGLNARVQTPTITIDRPFHVVIRDDETRSILFEGFVVDPTK